MDKPTIRAVRDLLLVIYDEQKSDWSAETQGGRKPSSEAQELYYQYSYSDWRQINEKEFEKWLSASGDELDIDFSARKAILVLPPLEKDDSEFVPILNLKCKIGEDINSLRLYVLLIRLCEEDQTLCGIGFRLESPEDEQYLHQEGAEQIEPTESRHGFYHAQLTTGFDYGPPIETPSWLPTAQPSFPLLAYDPVTLVFALLMTLYGKRYCWDFYNRHAATLPALNPRIKRLNDYINWKAMEEN